MTELRSGFVAVIGRPNVGKSTLVNRIIGTKVTIASPRPNTTRTQVRGVLNVPGAQAVFVDTPGLHRPRSPLGERLNEAAHSSLDDVDVAVAVVDATGAVGPGDRMAVESARARAVRGGATLLVVVNKIDLASRHAVLERLREASDAVAAGAGAPAGVEYLPVSSTTGEGIGPLVEAVVAALPPGPRYYPEGMVSDVAEAFWVADLVREQLLARVQDELPHSIACRVTEWEWPRIRCEILVERDSQKGIVIGRGGETLKEVGTAVRAQLPPGAYLELFVRVEKRWQYREDALDRLGL
ncbi:MAG: GTPase Era [Actinomycetota bacterium]|jgi:GTP-binding protein Era|nr:GTPase Era [Actinomycetota bacterium]